MRLRGLAFGSIAASLAAAPPAVAGTEPARSALLVTFDTTRADRIGCYGWGNARTPGLDELAGRGLLYERAWATAPVTLPSHTTLLTGVHPSAHGVRDNAIFRVDAKALLLSEVLRDAGFRTGAFVGSFILDPKFGLDQGFEVYDAPDMSKQGLGWNVIERPAAAVAEQALRFVDSIRDGERFFLWVHFYDPHAPHEAPPGARAGGQDDYDAEIAICDAQLRRILERLRARGLDRGLLTVVTADHGESHGEHGELTHGNFIYDATMRVPLIVAPPPPGAAPGARIGAPVSGADVAATILERLGFARDALPAARTPSLPAAADDPAVDPERAIWLETYTPYHSHRWHPLRGVVWKDWKYVEAPRPELYALLEDAAELEDRAASHPDLAARMRTRLLALEKEHGPLGWGELGTISSEDAAHLGALGYTSLTAGDDPLDPTLPDPKDRIGDIALLDEIEQLMFQASEALGLSRALASGRRPEIPPERETQGRALYEEARTKVEVLRAANPRDPFVDALLSTIEINLGNHEAAVPMLERIVASSPRNMPCRYNLAVAYGRSGASEWAIREMEKALFVEPRSLLAHRWLVQVCVSRQDWPAAAWWVEEWAKCPGLGAAEQKNAATARDRILRELEAIGGEPRPPAPVSEDDLLPEGMRAADRPEREEPPPQAAAAADGSKLLLVTWDTTRADRVGAYGGPAPTPCLDELAARGVLFERAFAPAPVTLPSHATLLTGVPPCAHGVRDNGLFALAPEAELLPEALRAAGFRTGAFVSTFVLDARFGLAQGFEVYDAPDSSRFGLEDGAIRRPAHETVDAATRFLDALRPEERWFLWVHFYEPHHPHEAPPVEAALPPDRSAALRGLDPYDAEIACCDAMLRRLLDRIEERGLAGGLVVAVTADHGESLDEHGEETHGTFVYDATMRVPLVISPAPAGTPPGARVSAPVSLADLAPTLLARAGLPRTALPAASGPLLPALDAQGDAARPILLESFTPWYAHRWHPLRGLVWNGLKWIDAPRPELYDLAADPRELRDLSGERPDVARRMAARRAELEAENHPLPWAAGRSELPEEDARRLAELGYVAGTDAPDGSVEPGAEPLPDPKDRIADLDRHDSIHAAVREATRLLQAARREPGARGAELERQGRARIEAARALLVELEAGNPSDPLLEITRATLDVQLGDWASALPRYERIVAELPRNMPCRYNLALCYEAAGRRDWARREMEKALHVEPTSLAALRWLLQEALLGADFAAAAWWAEELARCPGLPDAERASVAEALERARAEVERSGGAARPPLPIGEDELLPEGLRLREQSGERR